MALYLPEHPRRRAQLLYTVIAIALIGVAAFQQGPVARYREEVGIRIVPPEVAGQPKLVLWTTMLGGFRSILVDIIWLRTMRLKEEGHFFELVQLYQWILDMEPRLEKVWAHQAWELAYNISVECPDPVDRWRWIQKGIEVLRDHGIPANPYSADLYKELAWIFLHKIGGRTDDYHWWYKGQLALDMQRILGGPKPDMEALLAAPATKDELRSDPDVAAFLQGLDQERVIDDYLEIIKAPAEQPAPLAERLTKNRYAEARARIEAFARRRALFEDYHLEPKRMKALWDEFGEMDWRLPETHAVYWALPALKFARTKKTLKYQRMAYQAYMIAARAGTLHLEKVEGAPPIYITSPRYEFFERMYDMFLDDIATCEASGQSVVGIRSAFQNQMREILMICYSRNRVRDARMWFDRLRKDFPGDEKFECSFDEYLSGEFSQLIEEGLRDEIYAHVFNYMLDYWRSLALGQDDRALGSERIARLLYRKWNEKYSGPGYPVPERMKLPVFNEIKRRALDEAMRAFPPLLKDRLKDRIEAAGGLPEVTDDREPSPGDAP